MLMGPLSFLCAYGIAGRCPWRHTLQLLVSMGQLYGDVLYFMSAQLEGAPKLPLHALLCCCALSVVFEVG